MEKLLKYIDHEIESSRKIMERYERKPGFDAETNELYKRERQAFCDYITLKFCIEDHEFLDRICKICGIE